MTTLQPGRERPAVWWRIALLCFAGTAFFFSAALLGLGLASLFTGAIFVVGIVDLARTGRFRGWAVAGIAFGTLLLGAAIMAAIGVTFIIWATNTIAPSL